MLRCLLSLCFILSMLPSVGFAGVVSDVANTKAVLDLEDNDGGIGSAILFPAIFNVNDSSDTGAVFTADLLVEGFTYNGSENILTDVAGNILFDQSLVDSQMLLRFTVENATQVSGPSADVVFDGFSELILSGYNGNFNNIMTFNGVTILQGDINPDLVTSASPSGSILMDASLPGSGYDFQGIRGQFTVTAVPEPISLGMIAMVSGMVVLRRRNGMPG